MADDVGTVDSGLNSMVLASNNEMVLLPVNEPTFGTKRKSQIQVGRGALRAVLVKRGEAGVGKGALARGATRVCASCYPPLRPQQTHKHAV